jgi:hypothetical protein
MLNKKLTMKDIESIDPEFYNSLVWIRYRYRASIFTVESSVADPGCFIPEPDPNI